MNLNDDVVYRCLRLGPLHQLRPSCSRSPIRHNDCLHDNLILGHLSLGEMLQGWKARSTSSARGMASFRERRWNSTLPVVDVTSLPRCYSMRSATMVLSSRIAGRSFPIAVMYSFP